MSKFETVSQSDTPYFSHIESLTDSLQKYYLFYRYCHRFRPVLYFVVAVLVCRGDMMRVVVLIAAALGIVFDAGCVSSSAGPGRLSVPEDVGREDHAIPAADPAEGSSEKSGQVGLPEAEVVFVNPDGSVARFTAEVASTDQQRAIGLMYRKVLPPDRAMLFVFPAAARQGFYMKNTYVALDMVFVGGDGVVAGVVENARPLTLETRSVDAPAMFVVEINAFAAATKGIAKGSVMRVRPGSVLFF